MSGYMGTPSLWTDTTENITFQHYVAGGNDITLIAMPMNSFTEPMAINTAAFAFASIECECNVHLPYLTFTLVWLLTHFF